MFLRNKLHFILIIEIFTVEVTVRKCILNNSNIKVNEIKMLKWTDENDFVTPFGSRMTLSCSSV